MPQLEHIEQIEKRLWNAADTLRSNSNYASNEYFMPVMGLMKIVCYFYKQTHCLMSRFPECENRDVEGLNAEAVVLAEKIALNFEGLWA